MVVTSTKSYDFLPKRHPFNDFHAGIYISYNLKYQFDSDKILSAQSADQCLYFKINMNTDGKFSYRKFIEYYKY